MNIGPMSGLPARSPHSDPIAMIDLHITFLAASTCLAGVMSPGPNFIAVSHRATTARASEAVAMASGIAMVNVLWAGLALFGLGMLATRVSWGTAALTCAGATYLVWFGVRLIARSFRPSAIESTTVAGAGTRAAMLEGVGTNLANPKSMMFYGSVFTGVVPAGTSPATLTVIVTLVGLLAFAWYGSLALALSRRGVAALFMRHKATIERFCGTALVVLGLRQLITAV